METQSNNELKSLKREYAKVHQQFAATGITALSVLTFGAIFYHHVENLRWLDAFYFCTITLATVGYGDIVPTTDAGKFFAIFYVVIGIGILATFANLLIKQAGIKRQLRQLEKESKHE